MLESDRIFTELQKSKNVNNYKKHNNLNNHNNQNNPCSPCDALRRQGSGTTGCPAERATPPGPTRFRYGRPPSSARGATRADTLPGPRVLRLRRGGAPAVIADGDGGVGKEAVCARQSAGMDVAKWRVFAPSLALSPSAFPLRLASRPPSATPPACRQGAHVESEAKRRPKQHRSAIDQRVLIFIGEPAAPSHH